MNKLDQIFEILRENSLIKDNLDVLNVYSYGSHVYGTAGEDSDEDFIVVMKSAFLPSGAFRQNAISSQDKKIQLVVYSRTGFLDAVNNFEMSAIECLFLPEEKVLLKKWNFSIQKWDERSLVKNIISKSSNSWMIADRQSKESMKKISKKGIFHALRILDFGIQMKNNKKIVDFSSSNEILKDFREMPDEQFDTRNYILMRDKLMKELRGYK